MHCLSSLSTPLLHVTSNVCLFVCLFARELNPLTYMTIEEVFSKPTKQDDAYHLKF